MLFSYIFFFISSLIIFRLSFLSILLKVNESTLVLSSMNNSFLFLDILVTIAFNSSIEKHIDFIINGSLMILFIFFLSNFPSKSFKIKSGKIVSSIF